MAFQNVTIAGTGVLGSQIAYQTALNGFNVTAYDRNPDTAKKRVSALKASYQILLAKCMWRYFAGRSTNLTS